MSANLPPHRNLPEGEAASSSGQPEKAQYSLDEMMKALREKERKKEQQGEVVTRSDGTIARKVRRRRRRSEQPDKVTPEKERKRLLVKLVAAAAVILLLCLTALFLIIHHNSKSYREKLERQASEWTGAEVEFGGLKRLPFPGSINTARFQWSDDQLIKELDLQKISGDVGFSAFLGARPSGLRFGAKSGRMILQEPRRRWEGISWQDADDFPFLFDQYYCEALDVTFGEGEALILKDLGAILSFEGAGGYQVTLDEGFLSLAGWEDFLVSNALLRFKEGEMEVKSLSLEHTRKDGLTLGSRMELSGAVPLAPGEKAALKVETDRFPLAVLIGKSLSRFMSGTVISSEGEVGFTVGQVGFDEIVVDFKGDSAQLEGFPFMANLGALFEDAGFGQLEFEEGITRTPLSGTLRVRPSGQALENLRMAKKGKISLKGDLKIDADGSIRGGFEMSLNRFFFTSHPKLKDSPLLAGTENTGYVIVSFPLGGTVESPVDGFLQEIGMDSGAITPRRRSEPKDLWDDFQEEPQDLNLIPEDLKSQE